MAAVTPKSTVVKQPTDTYTERRQKVQTTLSQTPTRTRTRNRYVWVGSDTCSLRSMDLTKQATR